MSAPDEGTLTVAGAAVLGAVQGLTEFLPVSSSGHLVLAQAFIPVGGDEVFFDLVLHLGTLVPAIVYFRDDIFSVVRDVFRGDGPWLERTGVRLSILVLLATLPTAFIGLLFEDWFDAMFASQLVNAITFAMTAAMLMWTRRIPAGTTTLLEVPWSAAVWIGVAQGISIAPAISRSGATIATAMFLGIERETAFRLSFLMSIPAILGAFILKAKDVDHLPTDLTPFGVGALVALVTGYGALIALRWLVNRGRFGDFAWYVWGMSLLSLAVWWSGR